MERSHVEAKCHIICEPFLQLGDNPQGMDRVLSVFIRVFQTQRPLRREGCEESLNIRSENDSADKRFEREEACADIAQDLHGRRVEVINISSNRINLDDLRGALLIPDSWVVFDRIIANRDDHVRSFKKL